MAGSCVAQYSCGSVSGVAMRDTANASSPEAPDDGGATGAATALALNTDERREDRRHRRGRPFFETEPALRLGATDDMDDERRQEKAAMVQKKQERSEQ